LKKNRLWVFGLGFHSILPAEAHAHTYKQPAHTKKKKPRMKIAFHVAEHSRKMDKIKEDVNVTSLRWAYNTLSPPI